MFNTGAAPIPDLLERVYHDIPACRDCPIIAAFVPEREANELSPEICTPPDSDAPSVEACFAQAYLAFRNRNRVVSVTPVVINQQ